MQPGCEQLASTRRDHGQIARAEEAGLFHGAAHDVGAGRQPQSREEFHPEVPAVERLRAAEVHRAGDNGTRGELEERGAQIVDVYWAAIFVGEKRDALAALHAVHQPAALPVNWVETPDEGWPHDDRSGINLGDDALGLGFGSPVVADGGRRRVVGIGRALAVEDEVGGDVDEAQAKFTRGGGEVARRGHNGAYVVRVAIRAGGVDDGGWVRIAEESADGVRIAQIERDGSAARGSERPREVSGVDLPVLRGLNQMRSQVARAAGEEEALHESPGASRSRDAWPAFFSAACAAACSAACLLGPAPVP